MTRVRFVSYRFALPRQKLTSLVPTRSHLPNDSLKSQLTLMKLKLNCILLRLNTAGTLIDSQGLTNSL
ncbi:hypothetical protein BCR33DRAFT_716341 [Rhizoclosmatium globosum]|uniref:Uncharacterized protein n=1 Tax=Rhizoclosmatium globosum TaxID=329046 RepID=A0A1Y2CHB6_9FUNG|nr:hypothetical protein BCR33DRAFT_716341 [Rhizoclosmatium globosum]|eukprot:ORY45705.1 hypothetical protein BCR33DRAFT_716341 [Rhizoclosmatium globosum]